MTEIDPARNKYIVLMALRIAATAMIVGGMLMAFSERQ